jgi:hypothetical protein
MVAAHVARTLPKFLEACDALIEQCLDYRAMHEADNIAKFLLAVEKDDAFGMADAIVNITAPLECLADAIRQNEELFRGSVAASRVLSDVDQHQTPN